MQHLRLERPPGGTLETADRFLQLCDTLLHRGFMIVAVANERYDLLDIDYDLLTHFGVQRALPDMTRRNMSCAELIRHARCIRYHLKKRGDDADGF